MQKNLNVALTNAAFLDFAPVHMAAFAQFHAVNGVSSMMRTHLERFDNTEASPVIHSADSTVGGAVESMGVMKKAVLYARVSTDAQEKEGTIESQLFELRRQITAAGNVLVKEYIDGRI